MHFTLSILPLLILASLVSSSPLNPAYGTVRFSSPLSSLSFPKKRVSLSTGGEKRVRGKPSPYQYVGVVDNDPESDLKAKGLAGLRWFKRKRAGSPPETFDVRIITPNRAAILRDLLLDKKLDIYVKYLNSGKVDPSTGKPLISKVYAVRERRLTNMWGFNALNHVFRSNGGGSGLREHRLRPGVYTDGDGIFVRRYDKVKGKNEMVRFGNLYESIKSGTVTEGMLERLKKKIR